MIFFRCSRRSHASQFLQPLVGEALLLVKVSLNPCFFIATIFALHLKVIYTLYYTTFTFSESLIIFVYDKEFQSRCRVLPHRSAFPFIRVHFSTFPLISIKNRFLIPQNVVAFLCTFRGAHIKWFYDTLRLLSLDQWDLYCLPHGEGASARVPSFINSNLK